jgi:hypothetical protein
LQIEERNMVVNRLGPIKHRISIDSCEIKVFMSSRCAGLCTMPQVDQITSISAHCLMIFLDSKLYT